VITASVSRDIRVLKVLQPGSRRGPASEAQTLYEDLTAGNATRSAGGPAISGVDADSGPVRRGRVLDTGTGRPSKKERRQIVRFKGQDR